MKKEKFLINKLTEVHDIEILNKAMHKWNYQNISFKDALFSAVKECESFKTTLDNEPQKLIKYFKNIATEILLYDLLINSVEICKNNFIENQATNYLGKVNFDEKTTESLRWFSKTLRNNLVHHQDSDFELIHKNDKYKFSLQKNRLADNKNQTILLTETEFIRLLYFTILFWQEKSGDGIGSFEDDVMFMSGEDFSKATNTKAEYYIDSMALQGYNYLNRAVENFDKGNVLSSSVQLTSARCFARNSATLKVVTQLFNHPEIKFSTIKSQSDGNLVKQCLEGVGAESLISLETITKSILGSLDESFFKGIEISQLAGMSMENIISLRNSFIHNRYLYSAEQNKFMLFKKENYKSQKLALLGEISSNDLQVLLSGISHAQFNRESVKTYAKETFNIES